MKQIYFSPITVGTKTVYAAHNNGDCVITCAEDLEGSEVWTVVQGLAQEVIIRGNINMKEAVENAALFVEMTRMHPLVITPKTLRKAEELKAGVNKDGLVIIWHPDHKVACLMRSKTVYEQCSRDEIVDTLPHSGLTIEERLRILMGLGPEEVGASEEYVEKVVEACNKQYSELPANLWA